MSGEKQGLTLETVEDLKPYLSRLSVEDRAELAHFLILSLEEEVDKDAEAAWAAELQRRVAEIERGEVVGELASKVFAELRDKYR
jgi:putative addiction module component (TIGR02574 family)